MTNLQLKNLTLEDVLMLSSKCKTKKDFREKYPKLYHIVLGKPEWKSAVLNSLPHKRKWTVKTLTAEARKYKTRSEFMSGNISAYNSALKSGQYDKIISHMGLKRPFEPKTKWTQEKLKQIFDKCSSLKQLRETYGQKVVAAAKRNGWFDELSVHFKKGPRSNVKWTFERIKSEAKKYNSRKDFGVNCPSAYQKALSNNWIDLVTKHMKGGYTKWTNDKILSVIKGCETIKELKKKSSPLYAYLTRHRIERQYF